MSDAAKNFAKVTVSTGYDASATSIVLTSGHGTKLPTVPFNATWWNSTDYPDPSDDPNVEIVRVTARSTDTLTITRAQESTSASTKNTGSKTYKMIAGLTARTHDFFATAFHENEIINGDFRISQSAPNYTAANDDTYHVDQWAVLSDGNGVVDIIGSDQPETLLLLHCDGTDASTSFPDKSDNNRTVSAVGSAQVDTAQSKFGGASLNLPNSSGHYLSVPASAGFAFTGDYTIEFWIYFNSFAQQFMRYFGQSSSGLLGFINDTADVLTFLADGSSGPNCGAVVTGQWYHIAVAREGSNVRAFKNGTLISTSVMSGTHGDSTNALLIGRSSHSTQVGQDCWFDDIRITKGVAKYTGNFTAPSAAFTDPVLTVRTGELVSKVVTANKKFGHIQFIEAAQTDYIKNEVVSLSFQAKVSTGSTISNIRAAVLSWSGERDSLTSDVVSAWAAAGTSPTLATSWTTENTASNMAITDAYQSFKVENVTVDTSGVTNIAVFIWVDDTDATVGDLLYIKEVKLEIGEISSVFAAELKEPSLAKCQRFYQIRSVGTVAEADLRPSMRTTPSVSGSNYNARL